MRISMRKQRRAAGRPGALPNLRRICGHKTGAPTPQKGVRCGRPTYGAGIGLMGLKRYHFEDALIKCHRRIHSGEL